MEKARLSRISFFKNRTFLGPVFSAYPLTRLSAGMLTCLFAYLLISLLAAPPARAADDNANNAGCGEVFPQCDASQTTCQNNTYSWTSSGYPGGAGNPQCCGDDSSELYLQCSTLNVPNSYCSGGAACCPTQTNCVSGGSCYSQGTIRSVGSGNDRYAVCQYNPPFGEWMDCDDEIALCGSSICGSSSGIYAGSSGVGEYPNTTTLGCCGDDSGEVVNSCRSNAGASCSGGSACCSGPVHQRCVYNGQCYNVGNRIGTSDSSSDEEVCTGGDIIGPLSGAWSDQDEALAECQFTAMFSSNDCKSAGPGSICSDTGSNSFGFCCGDDSNEKVVTQQCGGGSVSVCCPSSASFYDSSSGNCVSTCPLPDLIIDDIWVNGLLCVGETVTFGAREKNIGQGTSSISHSSNFGFYKTSGGSQSLVWAFNPGSLAPGDSYTRTVNFTFDGFFPTTGIFKLEGDADTANVVSESSESNNIRTEPGYILSQKPIAPNQPTFSGISSDQVVVNWNNVNGESGYRVRRGGTVVATVGVDVTSWTDTTVTCGSTYSYTVEAYDNQCGGNESSANTINITCPQPDLAPSNPTVSGSLCAGTAHDLTTTVSNIGNGSSSGSVSITYKEGTTTLCSASSATVISAGGFNPNYSCSFTPSAGTKSITATVSGGGDTNSSNNISGGTVKTFITAPTASVIDGANASWNQFDAVIISWSDSSTGSWGFSSDSTCNASDSYPNSGNSVSVNTTHTDYVCFKSANSCGTAYSQAIGPLKVDTTLPSAGSCNFSPSGPTNGSVTATVVFSDSDSGISGSASKSCTRSTNGDCTVSASDNAGNSTSKTCSISTIDTTAPLVSVSGAPSNWQKANASASVSCIDPGGSGCASGQSLLRVYATNPGSCSVNYDSYPLSSPQSIATHVFLCAADKDNAGNAGFSTPVEFKVDQILPTCGVVSYTPPLSQWTNQNVTVSTSCIDNESGCVQVTHSVSMSANGAPSFALSDAAGNSLTTSCSANVTNIDKIAPSIQAFTITVNGTVYAFGSTPPSDTDGTVPVSWAMSDTGGSGVQQVEIWRRKTAPITTSWETVHVNSSASGTWNDAGLESGATYQYGIHALDWSGPSPNWNCIKGDTSGADQGHCGGVTSDSLDRRTIRDPITVSVSIGCPTPVPTITDDVNSAWNQSDTVSVTWNTGSAPQWNYSADSVCNASDFGGSPPSGNSVIVNTTHTDFLCFRNSNGCGFGYSGAQGPLRVDTTSPVISSVTASAPACNTIRFTVSASDTPSGVVAYSFDSGANWQVDAQKDFPGTSVTIPANQIKVKDAAGNTTAHSSAVTGTGTLCDTTPPAVSVSGVPPNWQKTNASASVSCTDNPGGSGCVGAAPFASRLKEYPSESIACSNQYFEYTIESPQSVSDHKFYCAADKDNAGNAGFSPESVEFKVDQILPIVDSILIENASPGGSVSITTPGNVPTAQWSTSDTPSGVNRVELWRAAFNAANCNLGNVSGCSWSMIWQDSAAVNTSPGRDDTSVTATGDYLYGVHVVDNAGNCILENGVLCGGVGNPVFVDMNISSPDFSLSVVPPTSKFVTRGSSVQFTINTVSSNGFSSLVSFSASGMGSGTTAAFSPVSCVPACSTTLTLTAAASAQTGTFPLTITGTGGSLTRTTGAELIVGTTSDTIKPTCGVVSYTPSTWTNGSVIVAVPCTDNPGGSGCVQSVYTTTRSANGPGTITIADIAGNTTECPFTVTNIDTNPPAINSLLIENTPLGGSVTLTASGNFPTVTWNTSDALSGILQVELWRANFNGINCRIGDISGCSWSRIWTDTNAVNSSPGRDDTSVTATGDYLYGIHVVDNAGNCILENGVLCGGVGNPVFVDMNVGGGGGGSPIADFRSCKVSDATVQFVDLSSDDIGITGWSWDFGDSTCPAAAECDDQHPRHTLQSAPPGWWNTAWTRRRKVVFNTVGVTTQDQLDVPVLVTLDSSRIDYAQTQNNGEDLRFIDDNGTTLLAHGIERWNESGTSFVWVRVPRVNQNANTDFIWMYYGNAVLNPTPASPAPTNVWDANFSMVHHLEQGPGHNQDSTSTGNNLSSVNTTQQGTATGKIDGADQFDGVNDRLRVSDASSLDFTNGQPFTVEVWFQTAASGFGFLVNKKNPPSEGGYQLALESADGGGVRARITDGSAGFPNFRCTAIANNNAWHYYALTYTTSDTATIFADGSSCESQSNGAIGSLANVNPLVIGEEGDYNDVNPGGGSFAGTIDEVRLSRVARSGQWIALQYRSMNNTLFKFPESFIEETSGGGGGTLFSVTLTVTDTDANQSSVTKLVDTSTAPSCDFYLNTVSAQSCTAIGMSWSASLAAAQYEILRGPGVGGPFSSIHTISAFDPVFCPSSCSYTDTTVDGNQTYAYAIRSRAGANTHTNSTQAPNPVCTGGTTICPLAASTPLCQVGGVTVTNVSCGKLKVNWNPVPGALSYNVYRALVSNGPFSLLTNSVSVEVNDTSVFPGQTYYYTVAPLTAGGEGSQSSPASGSSFCYRGNVWEEQ